ncbi:MAG: TVP38/TMEM64 family protein [Hyphomicrobium aestuarii]|nr:TVP38/TMEM64 family protein [Hyphomicrobium aestuarii]
MTTLKRYLPLVILASLIGAAYVTGAYKYLSLDALKDNRTALLAFVEKNTVLAAFLHVATYATVTALSLPAAAVLTVAGGFLFGVPLGATLTVIGATLGATILFVVARTAFGDALREKAGPFVAKMADGFKKDAFNYLLFLRLVPAFPFFAVNLVPALVGMKLRPFVIATALGIIPGTSVFTAFGASLGEVFDRGGQATLAGVLSPTLIAALVGLGLLSLLPIAVRRFGAKTA